MDMENKSTEALLELLTNTRGRGAFFTEGSVTTVGDLMELADSVSDVRSCFTELTTRMWYYTDTFSARMSRASRHMNNGSYSIDDAISLVHTYIGNYLTYFFTYIFQEADNGTITDELFNYAYAIGRELVRFGIYVCGRKHVMMFYIDSSNRIDEIYIPIPKELKELG